MDLTGKIVIITGAARGIGKAFAKSLLEKGSKVCLSDVNDSLGTSTCEQLSSEYGEDKIIFVKADVSKRGDLESVFNITKKRFQGIDIVINNAGIINEDDWERCIDVNMKGVVGGTLLAADAMRVDKGGRGGTIVNMSSMGAFNPAWFISAYVGTKHGVYGFTKSFAETPTLKKNGVRCVCICPSLVDTAILTTELRELVAEKVSPDVTYMSTDVVVQGLYKVLEDTDNNGGALMVNPVDPSQHFMYR